MLGLDEKFIERNSKQLILAGWSLDFQERISELKVSIPENKFLCMYLIALGIRSFNFQTVKNRQTTDETFQSFIPNWENDFIVLEDDSLFDLVISLKNGLTLLKSQYYLIGEIKDAIFQIGCKSAEGKFIGSYEYAFSPKIARATEEGLYFSLAFYQVLKKHF